MLNQEKGFTLVELLIVIGIIALLAIIPLLALWTDGNIEWWITYFKNETINIPYWISLVITIVFNVVAMAFNLITEICKLVL